MLLQHPGSDDLVRRVFSSRCCISVKLSLAITRLVSMEILGKKNFKEFKFVAAGQTLTVNRFEILGPKFYLNRIAVSKNLFSQFVTILGLFSQRALNSNQLSGRTPVTAN